MATKERADHLVFQQGLAESREQAKRLIMADKVVYLHGGTAKPVEKPGQQLLPDTLFSLTGQERFVSRGGYKLLTALEYFSLDVTDFVVLDAGASTGGFTDCLLQHGAAKVYAVDVGKHQLHERLVADTRVIGLDGVNLRFAPASLIPEPVDMVVADVSFIPLALVLGPCMQWLRPGGLVAALVKPQFELGPKGVNKGVVRNATLRKQAVDGVLAFAEKLGLELVGVVASALKGSKGNQEYMAVWYKGKQNALPQR